MNILETVGQYVAVATEPGLTLVFVPAGLKMNRGLGQETPAVYHVESDSDEERQKLRQMRAEAVDANQMRVLFVEGVGPERKLDYEADMVLSVEFGIDNGWVRCHKLRSVERKPLDTVFIYEA